MTLTLPVIFLVVTPFVVIVMRRINAPKSVVVHEPDSRARAHRLLDQAERETMLEDARKSTEETRASMARLRAAAANLEAAAEKRRKDKSLADLANELIERNRAMGVPDGEW